MSTLSTADTTPSTEDITSPAEDVTPRREVITPTGLDNLMRAAMLYTRARESHSADIIKAFAYGRYGLNAVLLADTPELGGDVDRMLVTHPTWEDLKVVAEKHVCAARDDMAYSGDGQGGGFEKVTQMLGVW